MIWSLSFSCACAVYIYVNMGGTIPRDWFRARRIRDGRVDGVALPRPDDPRWKKMIVEREPRIVLGSIAVDLGRRPSVWAAGVQCPRTADSHAYVDEVFSRWVERESMASQLDEREAVPKLRSVD